MQNQSNCVLNQTARVQLCGTQGAKSWKEQMQDTSKNYLWSLYRHLKTPLFQNPTCSCLPKSMLHVLLYENYPLPLAGSIPSPCTSRASHGWARGFPSLCHILYLCWRSQEHEKKAETIWTLYDRGLQHYCLSLLSNQSNTNYVVKTKFNFNHPSLTVCHRHCFWKTS